MRVPTGYPVCFPGPTPSKHSALPSPKHPQEPWDGEWTAAIFAETRRGGFCPASPGERWNLWETHPHGFLSCVMLPHSQFCRKWCCGGRVTSYGRACPTRQPLPRSALRAQQPWVKCGPPASCQTTIAGSRAPGPGSCWAPTQHPCLLNTSG